MLCKQNKTIKNYVKRKSGYEKSNIYDCSLTKHAVNTEYEFKDINTQVITNFDCKNYYYFKTLKS